MFASVQLMKAGDKGKNIPEKKDVQCLISTINQAQFKNRVMPQQSLLLVRVAEVATRFLINGL